ENVPVHRGDATEFVIFAILPDAIIDLGQMRHHAVDERLGELAHSRFGRTKIPEVFHAFRRAIPMQIAPEMKLNRRLPGGAPFARTTIGISKRPAARCIAMATLGESPRNSFGACSTSPSTYWLLKRLATSAKWRLALEERGGRGASFDIRQSAGRARLCRAD